MTRILVVDDEPMVRQTLRAVLERAGHVVDEAEDGDDCLAAVRRARPDLILMDINMPGPVDGIEATRQILQNQPVPIIMLTAYSDNSYVDAALEAGACAYLVKPITSEQLLPAIRTAISRFQANQQVVTENSELKDQLETRKKVERAKGILMERQNLSEADAFQAMQKRSRDRCQTMKVTAEEIINAAEIL